MTAAARTPGTAAAPATTEDASSYPRPPCLQALVARFGGYHLITPEAWAEYDAAIAQWHIDRRIYTCGHVHDQRVKQKTPPPARGMAPLLARLIDLQNATGLPPAYLPLNDDGSNKDDGGTR